MSGSDVVGPAGKLPRLPLAVRPSKLKPWLGFLAAAVFVAVMYFTRSETMKPAAALIGGAFLALVALFNLLGLLFRPTRLVLERDGLRWRASLWNPLVFTPWSQVRGVGHRPHPRRHDDGRLELDIAGLEGGRAVIPIRHQNIWGEDLPDLIRALAPHVSLIDFDAPAP
ncbi:MAG: hypothetical protein QM608_09190 [Caulobacter sp.]